MTASLKPYITKSQAVSTPKDFADLVTGLLNDPNVYVFREVLEHEKVLNFKSTSDDNAKKHYALLELFAYGKYSDYTSKESQYPQLTQQQKIKLQQLTIITLAGNKRQISYQDLIRELGLESVRDVENLIISTIYQGVITGKLNSEKQQFVVESALGRDVPPQEIDNMIKQLTEWQKQSAAVLANLEKQIGYARSEHESVAIMKQDHARQMGDIKANIKMIMEDEMENSERGSMFQGMLQGGMPYGDFGDDPRKRQGGKDKKDKDRRKHGM